MSVYPAILARNNTQNIKRKARAADKREMASGRKTSWQQWLRLGSLIIGIALLAVDAPRQHLAASVRATASLTGTSQVQSVPNRIGLFTGSFDPPHLSHKAVVTRILHQVPMDRVYVFPDFRTDYKPNKVPVRHRQEMLKLLFADIPEVTLLPDEILAQTPNGAMWDISRILHGEFPESRLFLMMGSDTFDFYRTLPLADRPAYATVLVNLRPQFPSQLPAVLDQQDVIGLQLGDSGVSSSVIRRQLQAGDATPDLPPEVATYIRKHGLYGCAPVSAASCVARSLAHP